jgi:3-hydroxy-9,10-secoandrosta-1,3,5(10)-triene-9,17-dione monooxygenase
MTEAAQSTTGGDVIPTRSELVGRAAALRSLLEGNAGQTETERRVAEENIRAVDDAGLFHIMVPRRFGGYETDIRTMLDVSAELAKGCGSTGWTVNLINVCAWLVGLYPGQAQQEVWGEGAGTRTAGVLAPTAHTRRSDGGLVVNGRWAWASGCLHAEWAVGGVPVVDESGDVVDGGLALMRMDELTIEDTWFVAGMKGTGSNTLVADEVFVPDHRVLPIPRAIQGAYPTEHKDEVLYRSALIPVLALILVGPQLGLASAALELVLEKASQRGVAYTVFEQQKDSVGFQIDVARAAALIDTAYLHAHRAAADIDEAASRGEYLDFVTRARVRMDTGWVAAHCREAVELLVSAHGASSFADSSRLQRIWRDLHVSSRHAVINPTVNLELYGKALLGVEPNITDLI